MPIFNLKGACSGGRAYAEGTGSIIKGNSKTFTRSDGATSNLNYLTVNYDFGFVPSLVIVTFALDDSNDLTTTYKKDSWTTDSRCVIKAGSNQHYRLTGNAKVNANGFTLPFNYYDGDATVKWYAYE